MDCESRGCEFDPTLSAAGMHSHLEASGLSTPWACVRDLDQQSKLANCRLTGRVLL